MKIKSKSGDGLKQLEFLLRDFKKTKKVGKVGWFKGAKYPLEEEDPAKEHTSSKEATSVAKIAIVQEYGYEPSNIPPRPFMRPTMAEESANWAALTKRGVKDVVAGKKTMEGVLTLLSMKAAGDVKKTISEVVTPPIKEETYKARLRRRGLSAKEAVGVGGLHKPLVDTQYMFKTLSHAVEKE